MDIVIFVILGLLGFLLISENHTKTKKIKELNEQLEDSDANCKYFARQYSRLRNSGGIDSQFQGVNLFNEEESEKQELYDLIDSFDEDKEKLKKHLKNYKEYIKKHCGDIKRIF